MTEHERLAFIERVLRLFEEADTQSSLFWRFMPDLKLIALCNDTFYWAMADGEEITPENVDVLDHALRDLQGCDGEIWLNDLFSARVRKMRPQKPFLRELKNPEVRALFEACGPERTALDEG